MRTTRDRLPLILAFVLAVVLHAVVVPLVASAVGRAEHGPEVDLSVDAIAAPATARAGEAVTVDAAVGVAVIVHGGAKTVRIKIESRTDRVVLSRDRLVGDADLELARVESPALLATSGSVADLISRKVGLPADADGPYWLIVQADADNELPDRDRNNNARATAVYIDGPLQPELSIDAFDAPDHATPGGSILIDLAVRNAGDGWAAGPIDADTIPAGWADRVYLSADDTLDETDLELRSFARTAPLAPGDGYRYRRVELPVPRGVEGKHYLIAVADAGQALDQPSFTAGVFVRPIELIDPAAPDLVVASIEDPGRLVINRPSQVSFSIANLGSVQTPHIGWADGLYLSRDKVLTAEDLPLTRADAAQPLQPRTRYVSAAEVIVPDTVEPGDWYLFVLADAGEVVFEDMFEDNNAYAIPVRVLSEEQADAQVKLGEPDSPERLVVQWIENDRLAEHLARRSRTVQPALQDRVDPDPNAALVDDPRPPTIASTAQRPAGEVARPDRLFDPTTQDAARPRPTVPDPTQTDLAPRPQQPGALVPERRVGLPGDAGDLPQERPGVDRPMPPVVRNPDDPTPDDQDTPTPEPGERRVASPADPDAPDTDSETQSDTPSERESDTDAENPDENDSPTPSQRMQDSDADTPTADPEADDPSEQDGEGDGEKPQDDAATTPKPGEDTTQQPDGHEGDPAAPSQPQETTRATRDESEAPPTNNEPIVVRMQEGRVLVGQGIRVSPKRPTLPGTGSRVLSVPRNARVRIVFDSQGQAVEADVIRSTTYADWDAAIEASLYRWTAEGDAIKNADPYVEIEWTYLLNEIFDDE